MKKMAAKYGFDISRPAKNSKEAVQWLYFGYLAAVKEDVKLIGLSALMTTTLGSMEDTIKALRESGHDCKVMVGGAVLISAAVMISGLADSKQK